MKSEIPKDYRLVTLHVEGVNMDRLSLQDIAAYMTDFAAMLDGVEVHFHKISRGSLSVQGRVRREEEQAVIERAYLLRINEAPESAARARESISRRMGVHRAKRASILNSRSEKVIEIPVVRPPETATSVPPLVKEGSLQGRIVGVSGRGDTVSVQLMDIDGHVYHCKAGKSLRRELAREAFDPTVRVHGQGKWVRDADGSWRVEEFKISCFEVLEETPLAAVIGEIRALPGRWRNAEEALDLLQGLRSGESSP